MLNDKCINRDDNEEVTNGASVVVKEERWTEVPVI